MSGNRDYNRTYFLRRFIVQILQHSQHRGAIIDLLPGISLAVNNQCCWVAIGLAWITGGVNFGWAKKAYVEGECERQQTIAKNAAKLGITPKQQALRWGW